MPILAHRIQALERTMENNGITEDDGKIAKEILSTYQALQIASSKALTFEDQEELIQKLFYSLILLEEKYFKKNTAKPNPSPRDTTLYIRELRLPFSGEAITKPAETATMPMTSHQIHGKKDPISVKSGETKIPNGLTENRFEVAVDLNFLLQEVASLVQVRKYEEAILLLSEAEKKTVAGPAREIILRAKEQINAERTSIPMPQDINGGDARKIEEEARHLLEEEKYEEAITRLHAIESSRPGHNEEMLAKLKDNAVNGLINRERNRAAKMFLKAKKINDLALKRETLSISRDILTDLLLNYPDSSLIPTVKRNLEVVEQALDELD